MDHSDTVVYYTRYAGQCNDFTDDAASCKTLQPGIITCWFQLQPTFTDDTLTNLALGRLSLELKQCSQAGSRGQK